VGAINNSNSSKAMPTKVQWVLATRVLRDLSVVRKPEQVVVDAAS